MHWSDNKLKKGQRRSLGSGATPITSATDPFASSSNADGYASSDTARVSSSMSPNSYQQQSPSAVRPEQHHPTVVAPPPPMQYNNNTTSSMTKSPSKARSFFRSGHHHTSSAEGGNTHINTSIPSPSLHMNTSAPLNTTTTGAEQEDDAALLHIKLKQEAEERAARTSPRSSSIGQNRTRHTSNLSSGGTAPPSYAYDGRDVYPSSPTAGQGHGHARGAPLGGGTISSVSPSTSPGKGAGGGVNAGWYMTTGVLPAVIQSPPPGQDNLSRSGSLGQRSRLTKYGSLFDATGLDRSGTQKTGLFSSEDSAPATAAPQQHYGQAAMASQRQQHQQNPGYTQNVTALKSDILDDTADATAANRSIPPHSIGLSSSPPRHQQQQLQQQPRRDQHHQSVSAIPVPAPSQNQQQHQGLPDAVANAAQTAQTRRNISRDGGMTASPTRAHHTALPAQQPPHLQGHTGDVPQTRSLHTGDVPQQGLANTGDLPLQQQAPRYATDDAKAHANANNQGRFQEEMSLVGRQSEDTPRGPNLGMLPVALASTGPSRGDSLKDKNRGAEAVPSAATGPQQHIVPQTGLSSYNRGELNPSGAAMPTAQNQAGEGVPNRSLPGVLPAEMGEDLPASEIARQRELQNAYATQGAREEPRVAASSVGISDPPASAISAAPVSQGAALQGRSRALPQQPSKQRQEVVNTPTHGPSYQTTRVSQPKIVSQQTSSYLQDPVPNISFPAPSHPHINELFGNIAQPIPHYMFVNYTASVCRECVESEKKMYALTHGGEKWRYTYADPKEEKEIPSDDPNTRKTGREEYKDEVSILSSSRGGTNSWNKDGKGPCQCDECLKNRATVKFAAENGLIEKIFEGRRHPASELIETITTTTIVRAPIIRETITTIWCEEPNCMECAVKQKEYDEQQRLNGLEKAMNGLVIHETGGDHYSGYKNLLDVNGARGGSSSSTTTPGAPSSATVADSKAGLDRLLKVAGNPRQEKMRRMPGTTAEFDGHIVGYDDDEVVGKSIEDVKPSAADMLEFVKSGEEAKM
ncbi:hypothetical protein P389DRAFT_179682 [Cystobasidium minutum MCA 4210]|uniref:uncharacterized protein n=1 Tax=Cystobasidium minutum MCA 4210 TaxID=1397322 RepID=UPI0034CFF502|eukprot:jgi/Rhomi1/179682/fgenesh1_pg.4_\